MMSVKQTIRLYDVVNKYFNNEEDSKILVSEIEDVIDNKIDLKMIDLPVKKDINDAAVSLKQEIAELRNEMTILRGETKQEFYRVRAKISHLAVRIGLGFRENLKWSVVLIISLITITIAVIKFF